MTVDAHALRGLQRSPRVVSVTEEVPDRPR